MALIPDIDGHPFAASRGGTVEQALDNLLANAFEASPANSSITISARQEGDCVALHVIDEGPGMTPQERARAFDRFWRGTAARPGEGSGLGLAIVRSLVERDRGTVELRAAAVGGIDAVVRLPRTAHVSTA